MDFIGNSCNEQLKSMFGTSLLDLSRMRWRQLGLFGFQCRLRFDWPDGGSVQAYIDIAGASLRNVSLTNYNATVVKTDSGTRITFVFSDAYQIARFLNRLPSRMPLGKTACLLNADTQPMTLEQFLKYLNSSDERCLCIYVGTRNMEKHNTKLRCMGLTV